MDQLIESCRKSNHYPCNLVLPQQAQYDLNNKKVILRNLSSRTFITDESEARVDFWEYRGHSFQHATVTDRQSLREHLNLGNQRPDELPSSRFIFLQAPHSRAKLLVSEDMLLDLLSYFQVMSSIVHALESFGLDAKKDFQHCQFEANNRLQQYEAGLRVPELKRSGHMLELCYSLRSVERSDSIEGRTTWSFKQTCVYHSFDVSTGLTTWIVIKGSDLFKKRIMDTSNASIFPGIKSFTTVSDAFASALAVQLIFGDWTTENWRWFVNDLEKEVQSVTRAVTFKPVTPPAAALSTTSLDPITPVANSTLSERARSWACGQLSRTSTGKTFLDRFNIENPVPRPTTDVLSPTNMQASQVNTSTSHDIRREEESYFETLQRVKALEERASEALLVLKTTTRILKRLQRTYADLSDDEDFPTVIQKDCKRKLKQFNRRLQDMQDVLENEALRVETLSTLLVGRKALVNTPDSGSEHNKR